MRRISLIWIAILLSLTLAALACRAILPENNAEQPGRLLFKDDFSDPSSGWKRVRATSGETDYADGAYRILVNEADMDIWSKPGLKFDDVRIEVDAMKVGGERDNRFGIICRATDPNTFYTFIVSSDGFYGIGKIQGNEYKLIGMDALQPSNVIRQGSAINHIRADCMGDTLTLYVNGEKLAETQDTELASGDVGLIAGTYATPGTDIRFYNFTVFKP